MRDIKAGQEIAVRTGSMRCQLGGDYGIARATVIEVDPRLKKSVVHLRAAKATDVVWSSYDTRGFNDRMDYVRHPGAMPMKGYVLVEIHYKSLQQNDEGKDDFVEVTRFDVIKKQKALGTWEQHLAEFAARERNEQTRENVAERRRTWDNDVWELIKHALPVEACVVNHVDATVTIELPKLVAALGIAVEERP